LKVFFGVFGFESLPVIPNFHTINANSLVAKAAYNAKRTVAGLKNLVAPSRAYARV
jgi:hypothetical protein